MHTDNELKTMLQQPYLNSAKMLTLIRRYRLAKDPIKKDELRETIFRNNVRFIRKVVMHRASAYPDMIEDAFNTAVICFFEGLDKFKPNKKINFTTYIHFWLMKGIYEEFVSRNIIHMSRGDFFGKKTHKEQLAKNGSLVYLDKPLPEARDESGSLTMMDVIAEKLSNKKDSVRDGTDSMSDVKKAMDATLSNLEKAMLHWRYVCDPSLGYAEIGKLCGYSGERIRQQIYWALKKVRTYLESDGQLRIRNIYPQKGREFSREEVEFYHAQAIKERKIKEKKV